MVEVLEDWNVYQSLGSEDFESEFNFILLLYFQSQINFHGKKLKLGPAIRKQNLCE